MAKKRTDGSPAAKGPKRSEIFKDPENLPSINEVLREFQRIRNRAVRVSPNVVNVGVDSREDGRGLAVKLEIVGRDISGCGSDDDWCVLCDGPKDNCSSCDAFDCIGCDAEEFHSQGDIVSNPAPMVKEITIKKTGGG
jgi:hypothetical protein